MFSRLDRYIAQTVFTSTLLVLLVLVSLFLFFTFIDEVSDIGTGNYTTLHAIEFTFLLLPKRIYEFFPTALLLGTLLGLGGLANSSELTVMRAAGMSVLRIIGSVLKVGLLLMLLIMWMGESLAPDLERYGRNMRSIQQSGQNALATQAGFWARDGDRFVHIHSVEPGERLGGLSLYQFDDNLKLKQMTYADSAQYQNKGWLLENVQHNYIKTDGTPHVRSEQQATEHWQALLNPRLIDVLSLDPSQLSGVALWRYVNYLKANALHAASYELVLWHRLSYPFIIVVMVLLAVPFVFGSLRSVAVGQRILLGSLLGISFYVLNKVMGHGGVVYGFNPILSAILPSFLFFLFALWQMQRLKQ